VSEHVTDDLALEAAGALDPDEAASVAAHLGDCMLCAARAAEWRGLAAGLRGLPQARPSPTLLTRTRRYVEWQLAERSERAWNRAALGFLIAFGWMLGGVAWVVVGLLRGGLTLLFGWSLGSALTWFAVYLVAGWAMGGAAAVLLGRRAHEEGRTV
jgi:anti-sigma factor RsiW